MDELQYVGECELAALITALHRAAQHRSPVTLVGAGLPQLRARTGRAKSYAERLFDFPEVGPLGQEAAQSAIEKPLRAESVTISGAALKRIVTETHRYPYFLQEWGKHTWDAAESSPIDLGDVERASLAATAALNKNFFPVRFDRLISSEQRYLRAMAELGPGPYPLVAVAELLKERVESLEPTRSQLIDKGMVWSRSHGEISFTVPLFDQFMRRTMQGDAWRFQFQGNDSISGPM